MQQTHTSSHPRLESLDILRGLDLFLLVGLEAVMHALSVAVATPVHVGGDHPFFSFSLYQ